MTSYKPNYIQKVSSRNATTLGVRVSTFPSPGDLPDTGIESRPLALQADALLFEPPGKPKCACLENPMDRGAWWAIVHGLAKSRTRLSKQVYTQEMATYSSILA